MALAFPDEQTRAASGSAKCELKDKRAPTAAAVEQLLLARARRRGRARVSSVKTRQQVRASARLRVLRLVSHAADVKKRANARRGFSAAAAAAVAAAAAKKQASFYAAFIFCFYRQFL